MDQSHDIVGFIPDVSLKSYNRAAGRTNSQRHADPQTAGYTAPAHVLILALAASSLQRLCRAFRNKQLCDFGHAPLVAEKTQDVDF
jgi:hypothetical protein